MASLEMGRDSYSLTTTNIDKYVTRTSAGNYALGYAEDDGGFIVEYVGRADSDVNSRLKDHVGEGFKQFKFSYASSPKAAFEKECKNYHDFGGSEKLKNKYHPDKPDGSTWKCPVCE
ncbi:hypothetical protein AAC03nite_32920 [Alicyclobacillus acidoterrestris]|nr:hypothetical protein AAC03nite_32920 [Alicyclobacillus acidoterrestris]